MDSRNEERSSIASRMRELRSTGKSDVSELHAQAERVTDWREHARAQPVLTAVSSTVLGFLAMRALAGNSTRVRTVALMPAAQGEQQFQGERQKQASTAALSLAGGIVMSVGRQLFTEYFKKQLGVHVHGANQSTHTEQRSNASSKVIVNG